MLLYALCAVAFALLVATIFRRSAVVYGFIVVVWIGLIVLSVAVKPDPMNFGMTLLSALNPTAAFGIGATELTIYEGAGKTQNRRIFRRGRRFDNMVSLVRHLYRIFIHEAPWQSFSQVSL